MQLTHWFFLGALPQTISGVSPENAKPMKLGSVATGTLKYPALDNRSIATARRWIIETV